MKVTVQICSMNRKNLLKRALEALFIQTFDKNDFEIIVVDDGSTDGTSEMVEELAKEAPCSLKLITQEHAGLATGRNRAIKAASGDIMIFIDDDIIADPHFIEEHVKSHEKHPKCVIMGWVNHTPNLDRRIPKFCMADISTSFFWTSNVSVERKYLIEVGMFDEDFKEYGWEDLELGRRLKKHGLKRKYNFKAIVFHYKGHWKKSDIPRLIKQAGAKARTAIVFLEKDESIKVKLTTAVYGPRLWFNGILNRNDKGIKFCEKIIAKQKDDEPLKGFALTCAQNLVSFHYFKEIEKELKKRAEKKNEEAQE